MANRFQYTCKGCGRPFKVELDPKAYTIHSTECPFCARRVHFDNRSGGLDRSRYTAQSPATNRPELHRSNDFNWQPRSSAGHTSNRATPSPHRPGSYNKSRSNQPAGTSRLTAAIGGFFESLGDTISNRKRIQLLPLTGFAIVIFGLIASSILLVQYSLFDPEPYLNGIHTRAPDQIVDRNGKLISELFAIKTGTLQFKDIPQPMIDVLLFTEDENFYSHGAIDFFATMRAMFVNIVHFGFVQGASTITQQLSRILLDDRQKTLSRKLKEAALAYSLESRYSKNDILTGYFNNVYLGHGAYGFETAAQFYFQKSLTELNFTERLALSSLPSAPARYSPLRNPDLLIRKMDHIYGRMTNANFAVPSQQEYEHQKQISLRNLNRSPSETVFGTRIDHGPYVTEYIRSKLRSLLGDDLEAQSGLRIETSIDLDLQKSATTNSKEYLAQIRKSHPYRRPNTGEDDIAKENIRKEYLLRSLGGVFFGLPVPRTGNKRLETASIGVEPSTGEVLFMQGGSEFFPENQLNRSIQMRRQTGSAIKPIIYSAGAESGIVSPATPLEDSPLFFTGVKTADGKDYWLPDNIDQDYEGVIPARTALAKSRNIPAIRAAMMIGLDRVGEQFQKFFFHDDAEFKQRFRQEQGVAIGILEMSPLEMASAFSSFANNGMIKRPYLIRRIVSASGQVLYDGTGKDEFNMKMPKEVQALDGDATEVMVSMLKDSAKYGGTGRGDFNSPNLLGKTGTTNKYRDAWFIGVLPHVAAAVCVGFDNPAVSMNKGTGATVAGPLFGRIIKRSNEAKELSSGEYQFDPRAKSVTVCADTGLLPNSYCPRKKSEIFARAGVPTQVCDKHGRNHVENPSLPDLPTSSDFN